MSVALLAGLAAIPGLVKAGTGIYQSIQANKLRKETKRPEFKTPAQILAATELAKREASRTKLPGQDLIEQKLSSRTASGVSALKEVSDSPVDIAAGVTRLAEGERGAINDLSMSAAQMRQANVARLQNALGVEAGYELEGFKMNEFEPYVNAMRTAANLGSAGAQNLYGGLDSAGAGALGVMGQNEMMNFMKENPSQWAAWMGSQSNMKSTAPNNSRYPGSSNNINYTTPANISFPSQKPWGGY